MKTPPSLLPTNTNEKLNSDNKNLSQLVLSKYDYIRNMEHSIRTPLNGIQGLATILSHEEQDPEKKEWLMYITTSVHHLLNYCNDILNFFKSDANPYLQESFDLRKILTEIMTIEKPIIQLKKLDLQIKYENNVPTLLYGDVYRLREILINLLNNAIKFTHTGQIIISVAAHEHIKHTHKTIAISICDTGIGITKKMQKYIYEQLAFPCSMTGNLPQDQSSGLGLKIVKKFIEEMNGKINMMSETGKGSTFTCLFPLEIR